MFARSRQSCSVSSRILSNTLPRWLCSMMPMPLPATFQISCCACLSTGSGRTAGPAPKFQMRSDMVLPTCEGDGLAAVELGELDADDVGVAGANRVEGAVGRLAVEVDARERGSGAVIDDVLDLFD